MSATRPSDATVKLLTGFTSIVGTENDRAVKAPPTGGLAAGLDRPPVVPTTRAQPPAPARPSPITPTNSIRAPLRGGSP
jgi:hypothetical protein